MLFRDVVSNISLGRQNKNVLAFYIKRLAQEQTSRTITAMLAVVLVAFQAVTFIAPPKPSEASAGSGNDILYGGFSSKADLLRKYDSNPELRAIYGRAAISRRDIEGMVPGRVNSSQDVWSMGRYQHGESNIRLDVPGAHTAIWLRPLRVWGNNKWFSGLQGRNSEGIAVWILYDCGNPVIAAHGAPPGTKEVPPPPSVPPPTPTPPPPTTPPPTPQISYSCESLQAYPDSKNPKKNPPLTVTFATTAKIQNTTLKNYIYDYGDGTTESTLAANPTHTYKKAGTYLARVRVQTAAGTTDYKPACQQKIELTNPNLVYLKQAVNLTVKDSKGNATNAAGTTVKAGDEIRYSISVTNNGTGIVEGFKFEENIADILEYADVTDRGGGRLVDVPVPDQPNLVQKTLVWDPVDIKSQQTVAKQFVVKVKSPIPATPTGASDRNSFDLKMENIFFNNRIEILLPPPPVKTIEQVSQSLPQTGSSVANTAMAFFLSGIVFIYLRNRLIQKELGILATTEGGQHHG